MLTVCSFEVPSDGAEMSNALAKVALLDLLDDEAGQRCGRKRAAAQQLHLEAKVSLELDHQELLGHLSCASSCILTR